MLNLSKEKARGHQNQRAKNEIDKTNLLYTDQSNDSSRLTEVSNSNNNQSIHIKISNEFLDDCKVHQVVTIEEYLNFCEDKSPCQDKCIKCHRNVINENLGGWDGRWDFYCLDCCDSEQPPFYEEAG